MPLCRVYHRLSGLLEKVEPQRKLKEADSDSEVPRCTLTAHPQYSRSYLTLGLISLRRLPNSHSASRTILLTRACIQRHNINSEHYKDMQNCGNTTQGLKAPPNNGVMESRLSHNHFHVLVLMYQTCYLSHTFLQYKMVTTADDQAQARRK